MPSWRLETKKTKRIRQLVQQPKVMKQEKKSKGKGEKKLNLKSMESFYKNSQGEKE